MPTPLQSNGQQGRVIPEYSKETVDGWLKFIAKSVDDGTMIVLSILMVLGFALFTLGVMKYMKQARDNAMGSAGGASSKEGITMMIVGALFGAGDAVALFLIMVMSSR